MRVSLKARRSYHFAIASSFPHPICLQGNRWIRSLKCPALLPAPCPLLLARLLPCSTYIPDDDRNEELDRRDECICPTDLNLICDDDLHDIFAM